MYMTLFMYTAATAIVFGGIYSAFAAKDPSRFKMWFVAYTVLIVGVFQLGIAYWWQQLSPALVMPGVIALGLYNIANILVIAGRYYKHTSSHALSLVRTGGALLAIAMIILIYTSWSEPFTFARWCLIIAAVVIMISMLIGLVLSARKSQKD